MSTQAINSINLYRGNNANTIHALLQMQSSSVVNELKEHFGVSNLEDLAIKLSAA